MLSLLSLTEPLRAANEHAGESVYDITFIAPSSPVEAVNGMSVSAETVYPRDASLDGVVLCASYGVERAGDPRLFSWLRWMNGQGVPIGTTDGGAFILAEAGLIGTAPVALHWMMVPYFRERFPNVPVSKRLFEVGENRFSCAGATTGMDLALHFIARDHGADFSAAVANHFIREPIRLGDVQSTLGEATNDRQSPSVRAALAHMDAECENPLPIAAIARRIGLSHEQLIRLFRRELRVTPAKAYQAIRLRRARNLVRYSDRAIAEVSLICGFSSRTQFARAYKQLFGVSPTEDRRNAY